MQDHKAKKTEEAIFVANEAWDTLFNTVTDSITIHDMDFNIVRMNQAAAEMFGLQLQDQLSSKKCFRYYHGTDEPPPVCASCQALKTGRPSTVEIFEPFLNKHLEIRALPAFGSNGQLVGLIHVVRDITERKQAEEALKERTRQLEDTNKGLESFSYSVSHDLKAPLRAINGFSRMLMKKHGDKLGEDAARMVSVICSNAERMGLLIDDLLSFSRVLKGSMTVSEIDMNKLTNEVWNDIRMANNERELDFKITKLLPGFGDRALIRQVLFNLISNAVKFTKDRKPSIIEMSNYSDTDKIVYSIKDNGIGFDMAYYDKIFGVFQRLHSQEVYEGTGVGLAIVQRIINRHGGQVWAEGKVDEGATFCFSLPNKIQQRV